MKVHTYHTHALSPRRRISTIFTAALPIHTVREMAHEATHKGANNHTNHHMAENNLRQNFFAAVGEIRQEEQETWPDGRYKQAPQNRRCACSGRLEPRGAFLTATKMWKAWISPSPIVGKKEPLFIVTRQSGCPKKVRMRAARGRAASWLLVSRRGSSCSCCCAVPGFVYGSSAHRNKRCLL